MRSTSESLEPAQHEATANIPAVLLLGAGHTVPKDRVELASHRIALRMPIKLKEFRDKIAQLVPPVAAAKS